MANKKSMSGDGENFSLLSDFDVHLFKSGKHFKLHEKLGAHPAKFKNEDGTYFAVWAPNAKSVSVIGNFNHWQSGQHQLHPRWDESGVWEHFFPGIGKGEAYKYAIHSNTGEYLEKADPFAFYAEVAPKTASVIWDHEYQWRDQHWMEKRRSEQGHSKPFAVYEVHFGSWRRKHEDSNRSLSYREMKTELVNYVKDCGFTHVEFMPMMEHPFFGSWGYQVTGYFAPTSRFGSPQEFMELVDAFHEAGIGVILDWVPSHFPNDAHGLYKFDGTNLYEHADPRQGFHPDWSSYIYNYGRSEVRSFLISNAIFWMEIFHADGLRVDAVASMLYLDYSRKAGEWIPNQYGGNENLEAVSFLKEMNEVVYQAHPDIVTIAEESTSWPSVSRPTYLGGLGFGQKWMMGWMHDTLEYFKKDPIHRKYHQNEITFSLMYAFTENFMLPLSHDEVVHGKGSLISRMPGDEWRRFANLRLMYAWMYTHPGTKLLFMGSEFGQPSEWDHDSSLSWHLLQYDFHKGVWELVKDLNKLYRRERSLYELQFSGKGFEWIDYADRDNSVVVFIRKCEDSGQSLVVVANFTPEVRQDYRMGVPFEGGWVEIFNSDNLKYGGSGQINGTQVTSPIPFHGKDFSISFTLPPLCISVFKLDKALAGFELE